jgi:hypothetical protein
LIAYGMHRFRQLLGRALKQAVRFGVAGDGCLRYQRSE